MRELLREKARYRMQGIGIQRMNKPRWRINRKTGMMEKAPSIFAERWRDFI